MKSIMPGKVMFNKYADIGLETVGCPGQGGLPTAAAEAIMEYPDSTPY